LRPLADTGGTSTPSGCNPIPHLIWKYKTIAARAKKTGIAMNGINTRIREGFGLIPPHRGHMTASDATSW
jgi:hypothetical protein